MSKKREDEQMDRYRAQDKKRSNPWQENTGTEERLSWDDIEPFLIAYVVQAVAGAGGSAQFTKTGDGGALGLRIYHDDQKTKTAWYSNLEDLAEAMFAAADYYRRLAGKEVVRWE